MKKVLSAALSLALALTLAGTAHATEVPTEQGTTTPQTAGGSCLTNGQPITEENVLELLRQLQRDRPTNTVWGTDRTPGTYKNEVSSIETGRIMRSYRVNNTYSCGAYASMVNSLIFGDTANPTRRLDDLSQIRPGGIILRVHNSNGKVWHVTVALESLNENNGFYFTDGNTGETVQWPGKETPYSNMDNLDCYRSENSTYHLEVWTRYPESVPYTGASINAWLTSGE